jgi:DNA-binding NtrC family response regulator
MTIVPIYPPPLGGVLVASPSTSLRAQVVDSFPDRRWPVQQVGGGAEALSKLESGDWQLLYLDRRLPDLDVEELLVIIKQRFPGIRVVLLDSDGTSAAVTKSWESQAQRHPACTPTLAARSKPNQEVLRTSAAIETLPGMVGQSEAMGRLYRMARLVAPRRTTVLILGATGTGKELVARGIHQLSPRAARPFVVVNCAAIPESLLESELFGHARGAFTGAVQAQPGRICAAQGGTLFLDEVGELPLSMQAKLLRFLEQREVQRLGGAEAVRVDVRVIAATNADLNDRVAGGQFREDLYYRLSAFPLELPPLADRKDDILLLAKHFLTAVASHEGGLRLSPESALCLEAHLWKGNVRELQHVIERASILAEDSDTILPEHLYFPWTEANGSRQNLQNQV